LAPPTALRGRACGRVHLTFGLGFRVASRGAHGVLNSTFGLVGCTRDAIFVRRGLPLPWLLSRWNGVQGSIPARLPGSRDTARWVFHRAAPHAWT
jgi:hypothetical protein